MEYEEYERERERGREEERESAAGLVPGCQHSLAFVVQLELNAYLIMEASVRVAGCFDFTLLCAFSTCPSDTPPHPALYTFRTLLRLIWFALHLGVWIFRLSFASVLFAFGSLISLFSHNFLRIPEGSLRVKQNMAKI